MAEVLEKTESTRYIKRALQNFAKENSLAVDECDFRLLKISTFMKSSLNHEFELYSKERIKAHLDREKILNEHIEFMQQYQFVIHKAKASKLKLNYTLDFGEHASHPQLILSPDSLIPASQYKPQEMLKLLYTECNKIKAYHGILLNIFDETMLKHLKILVQYIYTKKFKKRVKIALFEGIAPIITRKSQLIYWFKEKELIQDSQVREVNADELLIEYKKPIFGKSGLDCYGKIISASYTNNVDDLEAQIDEESIKIEEDANAKKYISKKKGYVHFNENHLSVQNKITLNKISRNAQSVASKEENNIEVTVSQHDTNRDSVGEGVSLKSESIHINGFVGAKSVLKANRLTIDGATHQNSLQYAKFANINRHKGKLRCHNAKIKLLEGGEVHATKVEVDSSLGGIIYAEDVIIGHVKSNLKVYASKSIKIRLMSGEDNKLEIGYKKIPILKSKIEHLEREIEDLKYTLEEATRHNPNSVASITKEIALKKESIRLIIDSYKDATITIEQALRGLNTITFVINETDQITYKTEAKEYPPFHLLFSDESITLLPVKKSIQIPE